jgi:sugar phosphate isomerase/epimerase
MKPTHRHIQTAKAVFLTICCVIFSALWVRSFAADSAVFQFNAGCQAYTFKGFTVYEAIEKTAQAGGTVVEFYNRQNISGSDPRPLMEIGDEQIPALLDHLKKNRVTPASCYMEISNNEAVARKQFEFAKRLGLQAITTESIGALDMIERLVKEFDIRVGFHGHARGGNPNYKLWDPQFILDQVKNRDPRIGACADTGHWASSGVVPLDAIKLLEGRIISLHLKDRLEIGRPTTDQIFGKGVSNIAGILEELKRQKFNGSIFIEYETNWSNSVPDVRQCLEFIRQAPAPAAKAR